MCNQELSVIIALNPNGRAIMTRDMELIRKIFAEIKSWDDARLHSVDIPGVSDAVLQRHLEMLMEGGLIEAQPVGPIIYRAISRNGITSGILVK
jgi:DNA-binding transcriptional ArsR family regulator